MYSSQNELKEIIQKCLKQRSYKQYLEILNESHTTRDEYAKNKSMIDLSFEFPSNITIIHEELLIHDEISLIGSIGGSLGLFVGFSFYGYATMILDIFFNQISNGSKIMLLLNV